MKGATDQLDLDGADLSERFETLGRYIDAAEEALGDALKPRATVADPAFYTQLAYSLVIAASRCLTGINAMIYGEQTARRDANPPSCRCRQGYNEVCDVCQGPLGPDVE